MLTVHVPVVTRAGTGSLVEADITGSSWSYRLSYRTSFDVEAPCSDSFMLAAMIAAMRDGEPVTVSEPVSGRLLERLPLIQRILRTWRPHLHPVAVEAETRQEVAARGGKVASFFSGGVDSFVTVLNHRSELSSLILLRGSEIDLTNDVTWSMARERCTQAADELGLELLTVETNVRRLTERAGDWNLFGHGAGFASAALLLPSAFRKVYIASSLDLANMMPNGSHPALDGYFGTEQLDFVHDGLELTRFQKVQLLSANAIALRHLRVCTLQTGRYNCGYCEKCVRTAVSLHLVGALDRTTVFPYSSLTPDLLESLWIPDSSVAFYTRGNLVQARLQGADDIAAHLEWALWRLEVRESLARLRRLAGTARPSRIITRAARRLRPQPLAARTGRQKSA